MIHRILPTPLHQGLGLFVILQCRWHWGIHLCTAVLSHVHSEPPNRSGIRYWWQYTAIPQLFMIGVHNITANWDISRWLLMARFVMVLGRPNPLRLIVHITYTVSQCACHYCINGGWWCCCCCLCLVSSQMIFPPGDLPTLFRSHSPYVGTLIFPLVVTYINSSFRKVQVMPIPMVRPYTFPQFNDSVSLKLC